MNKSQLTTVLIAALTFVFGFFSGREYMKYEIRSAFSSAAEDIDDAVKHSPYLNALNAFRSDNGQKPLFAPSLPPQSSPPPPPPPPIVTVALAHKGFKEARPLQGIYEGELALDLLAKNDAQKDIRAVDGELVFTDLLGNQILATHLAVNHLLQAGVEMPWPATIKFNPFIDDQVKLKNEDISNIVTHFVVHKVLFVDGTSQEF